MDILERYKAFVVKEQLYQPRDLLLLAVSGGIDSVVLCELCNRLQQPFVIAHCNFQLRGAESTRDEAFVRGLGTKYRVPVLVNTFDTAAYVQQEKVSIQLAARTLRYNWFRELLTAPAGSAGQFPAVPVWIATAHHADDSVETVLMNFFKGTGIAGLRGILPKQGKLVRPLLFARKDELISFAAAQGLQHVEDSSNASDKYVRNFFRHQLIPLVQQVFPQAGENMRMNLVRMRETEQLYQQSVMLHKKKLMEQKGAEIHISILKWKKTRPLETVTFEIIREFGFGAQQVAEVIQLMDSLSGGYIASEKFRIIRNRNWMIIAPLGEPEPSLWVIEEGAQAVRFAGGSLRIREKAAGQPWSRLPAVAELDAALIRFPLVLRKLRSGDYFYPLGMNKKKKIGRFLSDLKASLPERENTWVLEMNRKIIWVVGRRIDDRFKITPATRQVLELVIESSRT